MKTLLKEEKKLWQKGYEIVIGLDEVGRGALAGPVVAVAFFVKRQFFLSNSQKIKIFFADWKKEVKNIIKDSKSLNSQKREKLYRYFLNLKPEVEWGRGVVSEKIIDKINILEATKLAMKRAIRSLERKIKKNFNQQNQDFLKNSFLIIDGNISLEDVLIPQKSIIKGDEKIFSCAAASIIAKVERDRIMVNYNKKYSGYWFNKNKGYGTKKHLEMLKKKGPSEIHRQTFKPIRN